jgi:predicted RNase H-like HicB family nuclease
MCIGRRPEEEAKQNIKEAIELYLAPSEVELSRDARLDEVTVG